MVELKVKQPFLSPNLQVWSTPINSKLLITGSLGVDPHLVEPSSNYPRYSFLVKEDMLEKSIEEAIDKEAAELETILDVKFKRENEWEEKCLPFIMNDKKENGNHFSLIPVKEEGHGTTETEREGDTFWSDEEETLEPEGEVHWQNHFPPPRDDVLHRQNLSDSR